MNKRMEELIAVSRKFYDEFKKAVSQARYLSWCKEKRIKHYLRAGRGSSKTLVTLGYFEEMEKEFQIESEIVKRRLDK